MPPGDHEQAEQKQADYDRVLGEPGNDGIEQRDRILIGRGRLDLHGVER